MDVEVFLLNISVEVPPGELEEVGVEYAYRDVNVAPEVVVEVLDVAVGHPYLEVVPVQYLRKRLGLVLGRFNL